VRFDRLASLYLGHPLARALDKMREASVSILMYHGIGKCACNWSPYYETHTSPEVFRRQMEDLRERGYRAVDLPTALESLSSNSRNKYIVITFDDGLYDFYSAAYPILREHKFTATVFLVTDFVAGESTGHRKNKYMNWEEVRELHAQGIRFGSHTKSHPQLRLLSPRDVDEEIGSSKKVIEDQIGSAVTSFSYPFAFPEVHGEFRKRLTASLESHGYLNGVTTIIGRASRSRERYFLPRLPVNSFDDPALFEAKLEGGYDWLQGPQYLVKLAKKISRLDQRRPVLLAGTGAN